MEHKAKTIPEGKTRVLVVDDEARYARAIEVLLHARGYEVLTAPDGQTALALAAEEEPNLVLLDIRMPDIDGFEICRRIREFSQVPIIFLTALAEDADKVTGLHLGADDYVTKPFSAPELLARVEAVLRRARPTERTVPGPEVQVGGLRVHFAQQRVYVQDREVHLTPTEYRLLYHLARNAGRVLAPEYLLERAWGGKYREEQQLLRQAILRLRRKVEHDPKNPQYIQTRPGIGYVLVLPE